MKYLSDYYETEQSVLIKELGVFFAFSDKQFEEGVEENKHLKPEGTKWASLGMGMFMPSVNVEEFNKRQDDILKRAIDQDLKENGKEAILERELGNYEIGYSGLSDPNFRSGISGYGFTEEEIKEAYRKHMLVHEY